jgi:hypothetical protein
MTILHLSRASSTSGRGRATRTVKHDAAIAERDVDIVADDEVVENLNIEERPAARASAVRCRSSGLGVGSPEGWLWTRMTPEAFSRTASRNLPR